jgi:uncharacterized protein YqgC (DUF456 family)
LAPFLGGGRVSRAVALARASPAFADWIGNSLFLARFGGGELARRETLCGLMVEAGLAFVGRTLFVSRGFSWPEMGSG